MKEYALIMIVVALLLLMLASGLVSWVGDFSNHLDTLMKGVQ